MAHALALDSRDIALELHGLLRDLDPSRWRDEVEEAARVRLDRIEADIVDLRRELSERIEAYSDDALERIDEKLDELVVAMREFAPEAGVAMPDVRQQWMDLRGQLQPAYEGLAESLRLESIHVPSLRPTNYARNVFHVAMALLCLLMVELVLPVTWMRVAAFFVAASAWLMEFGKRRNPRVDRLTWAVLGRMGHPSERRGVNSATWFSTGLLLLSLTGSHLVCALALAVLGVADPAAGLIGRRFGRIKLIHGRSLEGTTAFLVAGGLACLATLTLWHAQLDWSLRLGLIAAAVLPAAIAELVAHRIDDNLMVPLAAAAGAGAFAMFVGIPL